MAEIDDVHARLGRADSLVDYLRALAALGVVGFDSFVTDGHSEFVADDGRRVVSPPHHERFEVAATGDRDAVLRHLQRHAAGETSYLQMSADLAASGVDKWVADTHALTMSYCDRAGTALLVEHIQ